MRGNQLVDVCRVLNAAQAEGRGRLKGLIFFIVKRAGWHHHVTRVITTRKMLQHIEASDGCTLPHLCGALCLQKSTGGSPQGPVNVPDVTCKSTH